jgi:hypothetical protein
VLLTRIIVLVHFVAAFETDSKSKINLVIRLPKILTSKVRLDLVK